MEELNPMVVPPSDDGGSSEAEINAQIDAMMGNAEQGDPAQENPDTASGNAYADQSITNQKDFNRALNARLGEERSRVTRRYEQSPEYMLGKQMLEERMRRDNLSADAAYKRIRDEQIQSQAQAYKENPENFYEDWLRSQSQPARQNTASQTPSTAEDLTSQLMDARSRGLMPNDFQPSDITSDFIANVQKYGMDSALAIWDTTRPSHTRADIVNELERRQQMPQPMRSNGDFVSPRPPDFKNMSREEFSKWESALAKRYR